MSKAKKIRTFKMFSPATYEGFLPNEQYLAELDLQDEAVESIIQRMSVSRLEALTKYEQWVYEL